MQFINLNSGVTLVDDSEQDHNISIATALKILHT